MFENVKRNLIYVISTTDIFAVSLIVPLYTHYLKSIEFSNVNVGLLNSLYAGVQFFASPVIGHLSDVHGSRLMLITSLLICSLCYPMMGITASFTTIACVRMLIGVVKHTQLLCKNYIEENTVYERLARVERVNGVDSIDSINGCVNAPSRDATSQAHSFGKLSGFMSLGYIVGPIIGGYFVDLPNGFACMCLATGVLFVVNSAFAYCLPVVRASPAKSRPVGPNFVTSFKNIPWSVCWDLFALKSLSVLAVFSFYLNYNLSVSSRYGISSVHLGYSLSLQGLVRAITGFAANHIFNLFPADFSVSRKIQTIYGLLVGSFFGLYFSSSFYAYLMWLVPLNVCVCFIRIVNHEALVERTGNYSKGIILGAFNNVTAICRSVLPLISGYLADKYGCDCAYVISITCLSAAICLASFGKPTVHVKVE